MATETTTTPSPLAALYRSRTRRTSPLANTTSSRRTSPTNNNRQSLDNDDSDDDNGNAPQLSALARMLLSDFPESADKSPKKQQLTHGDGSPSRRSSPPLFSMRKRVSWSRSPDASTIDARDGASPDSATAREYKTPAPGRHNRRLFTGTATGPSSGSSGEGADTLGNNLETRFGGSVMRAAPGSVVPPSTMRWKRVGRGLGGLAGAPRRGPRRGSDETQEEGAQNETFERSSRSPEEIAEQSGFDDVVAQRSGSLTPKEERSVMHEQPLSTISRRPRRASPESLSGQMDKLDVYHSSTPEAETPSSGSKRPAASPLEPEEKRPAMSRAASIAAAAASAPQPSSDRDKENMPPPTFRRPTAAASTYKRLSPAPEKPIFAPKAPEFKLSTSPAKSPSKNHVLASKSSNTPLRPAPPPPKMSMLQAVTATAGAASTSSSQNARRSRSTVHVNGKSYRRLDAIGKGGSSKVYKVMAENFKIFAMKKVTFNEQDGEAAIRGYKGEIDLLRKLAGEERVIRLFDYELNDEKGTLTMLMEVGETDLAKVLTLRHSSHDSVLDIPFVRYYWSEMLQCVQTVHRLNIIHSDLKPANFLIVSGRLKLIDFGIANAIQDDTVNVHRESQVGTLNYMSPEAIVDINAASGVPMASIGAPRLMKLGAPSDVWSLGCILYQMTYGRTPFSTLTSIYQKISAIPDPNYHIEYPTHGIGGIPVPRALVNTIKGCLDRDKDRRPTISQLLADDDPFLNPDANRGESVDISEDMLRLLLENACEQVERGGRPEKETVQAWARDVYVKLEKRMEERVRNHTGR